MFSLQNLSFHAQGHRVLENISFELPEHVRFVTLIGPNGAGKTTLLKMLAHLLVPSQGSIKWDGEKTLGYMPQTLQTSYYLPLRVRDFLALTPCAPKRLEELFRHYDSQKMLCDRYLHHLSAGEKQRVLFMKALVRKPNVLLLDEPTQGLDLQGERAFYEALKEFVKGQEALVIMASHDLHMVFEESDFVILLNKHLCCSGSPKVVRQHRDYQRFFSSSLQRPFVHQHGSLQAP